MPGRLNTQFYRCASFILAKILDKQGTLKSLVYASSYENKKSLAGFLSAVLKVNDAMDRILTEVPSGLIDQFKSRQLCHVILYEYTFGQKHNIPTKFMKVIMKFRSELEEVMSSMRTEFGVASNSQLKKRMATKNDKIVMPRYVRINRIKADTEDVISELINEGFELTDTPPSFKTFMTKVKNLERKQFLRDLHIPDLLIFHSAANYYFSQSHLYLEGQIALQDKASCIPAHVLLTDFYPDDEAGGRGGPKISTASSSSSSILSSTLPSYSGTGRRQRKKIKILDACAAPGGKTTHAASIMRNKLTIIAVDRDASRIMQLNNQTLLAGIGANIEIINDDFTQLDPSNFPRVEYIFLDPSCSGSGMPGRHVMAKEVVSDERLRKLACFQLRLLKHALSFPNLKRLIYSTCSKYHQENEHVVSQALDEFGETFELVEVMPELTKTRGSDLNGTFKDGPKCLRMTQKYHMTHDFFISLFCRITRQEEATAERGQQQHR